MTSPRRRTALLATVLALLAIPGCTDPGDPGPQEESQSPVGADPATPAGGVPEGVPSEQSCGLLTEQEAVGFIGMPLAAPPEGLYQEIIGTANCTWTASDGVTFRAIQTSITRTEWVSPALAGQSPEVTAAYLWEQNSIPQELDGETVPPLFDLDRPGPEGLGQESYYSPIGLCALISTDLWWCVSAGGVTTDLESPEAVDTMAAMAELVAPRIPASAFTGQPVG